MIPDRAFHLCLRNIEGDTFADPSTFDTLRRYDADPSFRAAIDAERAVEQAKINAQITESIARVRARRAADAAMGEGV